MREITSKLKVISGLHIGADSSSMHIGGVDSPVVKRKVFCDENGEVGFFENGREVNEPYIPGSSLKGKVRSLLEHYFRLIDFNGDGSVVTSASTYGDKNKRNLIIKLFGENAGKNITPNITRFVFRDCFITNSVRKAYLENRLELTEEKYENVIDRKTGTTKNGGLRQIERVLSSVEFDFSVTIRTFEGDDEELFEDVLKLGLKLLELDALGGSGSRGYGKVQFSDIKETIEDLRKKVEDKLK
jgi:CRISPR-associated protein Csm3